MSTELMSRFLDNLHASRLLDNNRIEELMRRPEPPQGDLEGIARFLEGNGWLTRFQIGEIREGRGTALTFCGYRLLERLADLPSGAVYQAFHPSLQKAVALRWIQREWLEPGDSLQNYLERARAASQVVHPNLVGLLDVGIVDDRLFVVQELVDGADLATLVSEMGALPVVLACEYTRQAALGLKAGADRGVWHGELTPSRMLLTPVVRKAGDNGTGRVVVRPAPGAKVKVSEFGLVPMRPPLRVLATGEIAFAAPERLEQSARDTKSDLWSLGAFLYFLLSARSPFAGATTIEMLQQLQSAEPIRVDRLRNDVPVELADFVHILLSRDPNQRPVSAEEVARFLAPYCLPGPAPMALPIGSAVPLASETGTHPAVKRAMIDLDSLPLAEELPQVEPLPAGTSDSQVYRPHASSAEPLPLPEETHHEPFADHHGFDTRPLRKETKSKRRSPQDILKIVVLVLLLFVLPWVIAALYITDSWPFDRPTSSSTTGAEKSNDGNKSPKKLKNGTRL
jgi:eukaryotic-like serine/threonine-protein kinase